MARASVNELIAAAQAVVKAETARDRAQEKVDAATAALDEARRKLRELNDDTAAA